MKSTLAMKSQSTRVLSERRFRRQIRLRRQDFRQLTAKRGMWNDTVVDSQIIALFVALVAPPLLWAGLVEIIILLGDIECLSIAEQWNNKINVSCASRRNFAQSKIANVWTVRNARSCVYVYAIFWTFHSDRKVELRETLITRNVSAHRKRTDIASFHEKQLRSRLDIWYPIDPSRSFIQIRNHDTPRSPGCLMDRLILTHDTHYTEQSHKLISMPHIIFVHITFFQCRTCHFKGVVYDSCSTLIKKKTISSAPDSRFNNTLLVLLISGRTGVLDLCSFVEQTGSLIHHRPIPLRIQGKLRGVAIMKTTGP